MEFDWEYAITVRNEWLYLYNLADSKLCFIDYMKNRGARSSFYSGVDVILDANALYISMSEEDKITVTLMGW